MDCGKTVRPLFSLQYKKKGTGGKLVGMFEKRYPKSQARPRQCPELILGVLKKRKGNYGF
jgi:hypothetical protein